MLLAEIENVEIVGQAADGEEALAVLETAPVDIVLLDIKMPGLSGLELLSRFKAAPPAFVFITAYSRFAVDAFELAPTDYLLKPVSIERLRQALTRGRAEIESRRAAQRLAELEAALARGAPEEADEDGFLTEVWVKARGERVRLHLDAVDWIEAEGDHIRVHSGGRSFLLRLSIRQLEQRLDPRHFVRVHRSALVRAERIVRVARAEGGQAVLTLETGAEVPVSRRYAPRLKQLARRPA
ncbi:LytTR family DNA-binding domain-containing protein [Phenylobacterium sp. J426]|uniref:LytR/AlgR family response regulator transcription factor n=1 Tax=Phenylobacterium sp. J426 TaxID=2898439 RepID=UPI0021507AA1|nr:LytTR family DNA-binding domain-containing protein [Phenylobacterium sp. J426]MCR5876159.1 LytTR family DNA-binding domain-containing protein [Phenylobacterium sp. J426]